MNKKVVSGFLIAIMLLSFTSMVLAYQSYEKELIPVMTGNFIPSPYIAGSSTSVVGNEAYKGFDKNLDTWWQSTSLTSQFLRINLGTGKKVTSYQITAPINSSVLSMMPKTWNLQASNTSSFTTYVNVDSKSLQPEWIPGETRTYYVNSGTYQYYRIRVGSNQGSTVGVAIGDFMVRQTDYLPPQQEPKTVTITEDVYNRVKLFFQQLQTLTGTGFTEMVNSFQPVK